MTDNRQPITKQFIATIVCYACGKTKVRVYDWLPEPVLCRGCEIKEQRYTELAAEYDKMMAECEEDD